MLVFTLNVRGYLCIIFPALLVNRCVQVGRLNKSISQVEKKKRVPTTFWRGWVQVRDPCHSICGRKVETRFS